MQNEYSNNPTTPKPRKITIQIIIFIILIFVGGSIYFAVRHSDNTTTYLDENWGSSVIYSNTLSSFIYKFDSYISDNIEDQMDEYFLPLYPKGIGLNIVSRSEDNGTEKLRLISSYGTFHNFKILIEWEKSRIYIGIDDFEKVYSLDYSRHDDEVEEEI